MQPESERGHRPTILLAATLLLFAAAVGAAPLEVRRCDSIIFLGNTFAERLHLFGYFETFLHSQFADHRLRVRNLGWSADEVALMPRPRGFPGLHDQLSSHQTDLIFACFGMNESFRGPQGLEGFRKDLDRFVGDLLDRKYNGSSPPRVVLVSPIAHEDLGGNLPDGRQRNRDLKLYTSAMARVAKERGASFVDLFTPTSARDAGRGSERKLTFNGIHLTEYGDWVVSQMMARALGLIETIAPPAEAGGTTAEKLRRAVYEKNYQFTSWWRAPNASYIHGGRNRAPGAARLPAEREQQVRLIEAHDGRIWAAAKPDPAEVWQRVPVDGRPVWFPTPSDAPIPGDGDEPEKDEGSPPAAEGERGPTRSPRQALESFELPEGYRANLFASEVDFPIANPLAMSFDARGRLWVANSPTWPHPLPGRQPRDSIVVLADTDRDGVADEHTVFIDKLNMVHGFALGDGGVYISQAPNMIFARDTDGDNRADWVRMVLHGFGTEDVEHAMNNFRWSPGGSIFLTQGIFYHTQVETPYGPRRVRDAAVFRYRPAEHRLEVFVSHHFWNPYGNVFDRWGRGIVLDASAGQYYPMDVLSANFVYPKVKKRTDHLSFAPGGAIASGCDFIRSRHFPPEVQGRFLVNHCVRGQGTHWFDLESKGAIYSARRHEPSLLASNDPVFRPIAMDFGPDGALYVLDFYSYIFENVNFSKRHRGRDHTHGRVWRISCEGRPLSESPGITGRPVPVLLDLLKAYENTTRGFARRELQERRRDAVVPALRRWIAALDPSDPEHEHHLLEALWVLQGLDVVDAELLGRLLGAREPRARAAATRVLRYWQDRVDESLDLLRRLVDDPDARVRLEAVLACGFSRSEEAQEVALEAAEHPMDPGLRLALDQTLDFLEQTRGRE